MAYISFHPKDFFKTYLYTPGGSGGHTNSSLSFQPDWVWFKQRNGSEDHGLYDSVRGVTKRILSNTNGAETTESTGLTSFTSSGWVTGADGKSGTASQNYVSWNWKGGGASSSNSNGSVTSTVSANTTAGFSVVKYTNPSSGSPFTVGHGLGVAPEMIMIKSLSGAQNWGVWHQAMGFGKYVQLNTTIAQATANLVTATSSTTFSTYYDHHTNGHELIAYCFAPVKGYSKFSQYIGNNSTNGARVYTGFKPGLVLTKRFDGTSWWAIHDTKREGYNSPEALFPNTTDAESAGGYLDILSNGFKLKTTNGNIGGSAGDDFFYAAFAEESLVSSNGDPATAF